MLDAAALAPVAAPREALGVLVLDAAALGALVLDAAARSCSTSLPVSLPGYASGRGLRAITVSPDGDRQRAKHAAW